MKLFIARQVVLGGDVLDRAGLLVHAGLVERVVRGPGALRRAARDWGARVVDLGDGTLAPGLVNAHAHLDLSALAGRASPRGGFGAWVARVVRLRAEASDRELSGAATKAADGLLAAGTTAIGDVDSTGVGASVLGLHPLFAVSYREVLDAGDPARTRVAVASVGRALPPRRGRLEGLSPHAPFTVSPGLFTELGRIARRRGVAATVHWAETEAESEWLLDGRGPLARLLGESPRRRGLELIEEAGLLTPSTSLVHGNFPDRGEALRIARAGVTLVHCPGTHRFFGRAPFPLEHYRARGVHLALGTDSLASNEQLDMRREMALVRAAFPGLSPTDVWAMATVGGAQALGLAGSIGELRPGHRADFCLFRTDVDRGRCFDLLTAGIPPVEGVWIAGRQIRRSSA